MDKLDHSTGVFLVVVNCMVIVISVGTIIFQFLKSKEGSRQASQRGKFASVELQQYPSVPDDNEHDYQLME